jgi:thiamine-monophosphate kinase
VADSEPDFRCRYKVVIDEPEQALSNAGESALVERLTARLGPPPAGEVWSGDDTAVVLIGDEPLLFTVDSMVEGVDFDLSYCTGSDVGWKALAINVSDIAAMGGRPRRAVASVTLRPELPVAWLDELMTGLTDAAARWDVGLAGGDLSGGTEISITIALLGSLVGGPVLRSGAKPGDVICVTGRLGGAAGGLIALQENLARSGAVARLVDRQLRPRARLEAAAALAGTRPSSMIDVSDGLAIDLTRVLDASGAGCRIERAAVPVDPDLEELGDRLDPLAAALTGGEDFELLFTLVPERLDAARAALHSAGAELTVLGTITADSNRQIDTTDLADWRELAWEHLQDRSRTFREP